MSSLDCSASQEYLGVARIERSEAAGEGPRVVRLSGVASDRVKLAPASLCGKVGDKCHVVFTLEGYYLYRVAPAATCGEVESVHVLADSRRRGCKVASVYLWTKRSVFIVEDNHPQYPLILRLEAGDVAMSI